MLTALVECSVLACIPRKFLKSALGVSNDGHGNNCAEAAASPVIVCTCTLLRLRIPTLVSYCGKRMANTPAQILTELNISNDGHCFVQKRIS